MNENPCTEQETLKGPAHAAAVKVHEVAYQAGERLKSFAERNSVVLSYLDAVRTRRTGAGLTVQLHFEHPEEPELDDQHSTVTFHLNPDDIGPFIQSIQDAETVYRERQADALTRYNDED